MPTLSIWMIRFSLLYLILTLITGSFLLLNKAFHWNGIIWILLGMHIEVALLGWVVQFVFGTAYWMFPRYLTGLPRGGKREGWLMMILLNASILLSAGAAFFEGLLIFGRVSLFAAVLLFLHLMWSRVVSYRNKR